MKPEKIVITLDFHNFDAACKQAYSRAISLFMIDESGHCLKYPEVRRFAYTLVVEFQNYRHSGGMSGHSMEYTFKAWLDVSKED